MKNKVHILLLILFASTSSFSQVTLPKLIGDGMVLQRDTQVKIWGWASEGENISIRFIGSEYAAIADDNGEWQVLLFDLKAGGPYEMRIEASNSVTIKDILVGDVWVCSGQSNMGVSMSAVSDIYPDEIKDMNNPFIRQFFTFPRPDFSRPAKDFRFGRWQVADSNNLRSLTAVGYFFAKKLYEEYQVPIGLISSNMGGSSAEAWISEESIKTLFSRYFPAIRKLEHKDVESPYDELIHWFFEGDGFELLDDLNNKEYQEQLNSIPALNALVKEYQPDTTKADIYFIKEFLLWGLVVHKKLSKHRFSKGIQFKDLYGSYISRL